MAAINTLTLHRTNAMYATSPESAAKFIKTNSASVISKEDNGYKTRYTFDGFSITAKNGSDLYQALEAIS